MGSQPNNRIRRATVALLTLAFVLSNATLAAADPVAPELSGPNVISYEEGYPDYVLLNATKLIRQGTRMTDGCTFVISETGVPGSASSTEIELQYDPDTCRLLVEIGILQTPRPLTLTSDEAAETVVFQSGNPETTTALQTPGFGSGPVPGAPYSANAFRAYVDQWHDEPARWIPGESVYDFIPPVNEQLNFVEWTPGGGCAVAPGTIGWTGYWQRWLTLTGWYRVSNVWTHSSDPIPCTEPILSRSQVHFQNRAFCAFLAENIPGLGPILGPIVGEFFPTNVFYDPNHIQGNADGSYTFNMVKTKSGPCSVLLRGAHTTSYY